VLLCKLGNLIAPRSRFEDQRHPGAKPDAPIRRLREGMKEMFTLKAECPHFEVLEIDPTARFWWPTVIDRVEA
jgi:hypothetical protein